jgi:hypothetical protein
MSLTKLPLGRNNSVMTSLFPPRESVVVTSRMGTGNSRTFFLRCTYMVLHILVVIIEFFHYLLSELIHKPVFTLCITKAFVLTVYYIPYIFSSTFSLDHSLLLYTLLKRKGKLRSDRVQNNTRVPHI